MKNQLKRWLALAMMLSMMLSLVPVTVGAVSASSGVKSSMQEAAAEVGCHAVGSVTVLDAGSAGAEVAGTLTCSGANQNQSAFALVQAVNEKGEPLAGHGPRYIMGEFGGNSISVVCQENGSRYFAVMPVQSALEQGNIDKIKMTCAKSGSGYTVSCNAELIISADLAMMAGVAQGNDGLKNVRITCYLENDLLKAKGNVDLSKVKLSDPKGIYRLENASSTDQGVKIVYRINDTAIARWTTMSSAAIREEVETKVTMSCSETVTEDQLRKGLNQENISYTYGRVEITYGESGAQTIPGLDVKKIVVPASLARMYVELPQEVPEAGGGISTPNTSGVADWLNTVDHTAFMQGDELGNFRPNANVTRAEVAMIFYRLLKDQNVAVTVSFSDVPSNAWYAQAVNTLASLGIINGVGDGTFAPTRAIKRCEFAAICSRFAKEATGGPTFTDVPASHWAYKNINTCAAYGWINGVGDGTFQPDRTISRAETATMVNRMLGRLGDKTAIDAGLGRKFPDVTKAHWAWYQIGEATATHNYTMNSDRTQETWN